MRVLGTTLLSLALIEICAPAHAIGPMPETGAAKLAAYQVCRPLAAIEMGALGSQTSTECHGIVKNLEGQERPNNLSIHCMENTSARPDSYRYSGSCVQTDGDGDKLYMTYEGTKTGQVKWIGGTGKYKDVQGAGDLRVDSAPSLGSKIFAYTLDYNVKWTNKAK